MCTDGYENRCKTCAAANSRAYYKANRQRCLAATKDYHKQNPDVHYRASKKYRLANAVRDRDSKKAWRERNPEQARAISVSCTNRRRARLSASIFQGDCFTPQEWLDKLVEYKSRCALCNIHALDTVAGYLEADHIIPVCKGGRHVINNIQPLCGPCNNRKGGTLLIG
jgi:5-methylcytosine-specific restriction endonuclease McrA